MPTAGSRLLEFAQKSGQYRLDSTCEICQLLAILAGLGVGLWGVIAIAFLRSYEVSKSVGADLLLWILADVGPDFVCI